MPYNAVYSASKAGLLRFAEGLGRELPENDILSVTPFYVSTKMTKFQKLSFETIGAPDLADNILRAAIHIKNEPK
jgi:short-subunit dehydrogenase